MEKSRPYVILSAAMTLDGKIGKNFTKIKFFSDNFNRFNLFLLIFSYLMYF